MGLVLLILASGLFNTFVSIRLELEGFSADAIGMITALLYAGILIGSIVLPLYIEKWGYLLSYTLFVSMTTLLVLAQVLWMNPYYWGFLRMLGGICTAGIFIVVESWFLLKSPPNMRSLALSLYLGVFYCSLSVGQFLLNISDPKSSIPFYITASLCLAGLIPIFFGKDQTPKIKSSEHRLSIFKLFKTSPYGFMGGVISGMLLAAVYGLVPVYGKKIGMEIADIGTLMAIIIFGGFLFQWPLAKWSDRGNRKTALNATCFSATFFSLIIAFLETPPPTSLMVLAWFFGGFAFTIYPLSMAYMCEKIEENQIVAATGGFILAYSMGAVAGPILAPFAMSFLGHSGLFYFLGTITFLLGLFGLKKSSTTIEV